MSPEPWPGVPPGPVQGWLSQRRQDVTKGQLGCIASEIAEPSQCGCARGTDREGQGGPGCGRFQNLCMARSWPLSGSPPHPCWLPGPWKPCSPAGTRREKQGPVAHLGSFLGRGQRSAVRTEDHAGLTLLTLEPEQRSHGGQLQGEGPPTTAAEPQRRGPQELARTVACKQACPLGLCGWESWWVPHGSH